MQEKAAMRSIKSSYRVVLVVIAWLFLSTSWFCLIAASWGFVNAAQDYGVLDIRTFLDAEFGYYGLFSFGAASIAVLFAVKGNVKSDLGSFRLFKLTFLLSIVFLAPVFFSTVVFLMSEG